MQSTIFYTGSSPLSLKLPAAANITVRNLPTITVNYKTPENIKWIKTVNSQNSYLVFLSKNSVLGLKHFLAFKNFELTPDQDQIWAVGPGTKMTLKTELNFKSNIPEIYSGAGLTAEFKNLPGYPVFIICGQETLHDFPGWLKKEQRPYEFIKVYRTRPLSNPEIKQHFNNSIHEIIFFTSPKTVSGFLNSIGRTAFSSIFSRLASIGPTTSKMIRANGGKVFFEAELPNINKAVTALINHSIT
ncbi:MAG: uroporphyrinogen-III synthase [Candidatus Neomarinimicrobiota bacterium]